ncbi:MAG: pilus assembly protein [Methylacidiphilales bacterium]|nr:pilus assembly protein [Candidatus Methylacidiphilales bacterium]
MNIARRSLHRVNRFGRNTRAVAATEFALILPFMLILWLGGVEVTQLLSIDRKAAQATRTIADLVAQVKFSKCDSASNEPSDSDLKTFFDAADEVVSPYPVDPMMAVVVSCLEIDKNGVIKVMWSQARRGDPRTAAPPLEEGLNDTNATTYWVLGEATYTHTPTIGYVLTGPFNLSEQVYMRSRI